MHKLRRVCARLVLSLALVASLAGVLAVVAPQTVPTARAASYCQCTDFVASIWGLTGYPDAKYWDTYLPGNYSWLFAQDGILQAGDIVVFQPGCYGGDGNCGGNHWMSVGSAGHVGVLDDVTWLDGSHVTLTLRGANQPGTWFTENNCYDVTIIHPSPIYIYDGRITYWRDYRLP